MRTEVSAILRAALELAPSEADLDSAIAHVCTQVFGSGDSEELTAVLDALDSFSRQFGCSRLDAARRMAQGQASVRTTRFSSIEEAPPEIQARMREMMESGEAVLHENVSVPITETRRAVTWTPEDGGEPPISAEALREMTGSGPMTMTFALRGRSSKLRIALMLGFLAMVLVALLPLLKLMSRPGAGGTSKRLGGDVPVLERLYADDPESKAIAFQLAEAYARRVVAMRSAIGLKEYGRVLSDGKDKALAARWRANTAAMEKLIGVTATKAELRSMAERGLAVTRKLLNRAKLKKEQRVRSLLLMGRFQLALNQDKAARESSDRAAALDRWHIAPQLLNAEIFERRKEYGAAIAENLKALSKLSAWVKRDPTLSQAVLWRMGSRTSGGAFSKERGWRDRRRKVAAAIRQGIDMHVRVLRLLEKAKKVLK